MNTSDVREIVVNQSEASGVSKRYSHVSTAALLQRLQSKGFVVNEVQAANARKSRGFQRHLVRLQHPDLKLRDGLIPQVIIVNAHDGTAATRIMLGIYRFACANGLIVGSSFKEYRVRHVGPALENCLSAVDAVAAYLPALAAKVERLSALELGEKKQRSLSHVLAEHLLKSKDSVVTFSPSDLNRVRREADRANDAFTVLNRLQENALGGGLRYATYELGKGFQPKRLRAVKSIERKTAINQYVWDLVERQAA